MLNFSNNKKKLSIKNDKFRGYLFGQTKLHSCVFAYEGRQTVTYYYYVSAWSTNSSLVWVFRGPQNGLHINITCYDWWPNHSWNQLSRGEHRKKYDLLYTNHVGVQNCCIQNRALNTTAVSFKWGKVHVASFFCFSTKKE